MKIHLSLENIISPIQQIVLQLRHGIISTDHMLHQKMEDEKISNILLPLAVDIVCKGLVFHLSTYVFHCDGIIERHVHLSWKEYEKKRDPKDHGRILPCKQDELINGMIAYLGHLNNISVQSIKTVYYSYDCFGELLLKHSVLETSWISKSETETILHKRILEIQSYFHSETLPPCSEEQKGRWNIYCEAQCPVRSHCSQRKQDIEEAEQKALETLNPTQESEISAVLPDVCNQESQN